MITVRLPNGREIDIDTDDPKAAQAAARKFLGVSENPAKGLASEVMDRTDGVFDKVGEFGRKALKVALPIAAAHPAIAAASAMSGDRARAAAQGVAFDHLDEAAGAVAGMGQSVANFLNPNARAPTGKQTREAVTEEFRSRDAAYAKRAPIESTALKIGGAVANPASYTGAGFIARGTSLPAVAARSAIVGAGMGALAGEGAGEGVGGKLRGAALGGVIGAGAGAVTGSIARAAQGVAGRAGAQVDQAEGIVQARQAIEALGGDFDNLAPPVQQQITRQIAQGIRPQDAAMRALGESLPVPVPMSRGQMSGNPADQIQENIALRGGRGAEASTIARGFRDTQQEALGANIDAINSRISGGPPVGRDEGGQAVSQRLNTMYDQADDAVGAAYRTAREVGDGAHLPQDQIPVIGQRVREAVRDYDPARVPSITRELDRLDTLSTPTARDLFEARTRLTKLRASNDGVEGSAAGQAVRGIDGYIDEAMAADLFTGDPQAVAAWRTAIGQRRDMGALFQRDDLINRLTERTMRGEGVTMRVAPEDAANYILGRSNLGFVGKQNLSRDLNRLRTVLGAESGEWNALRAEAFQRIASEGMGGVEGGVQRFSGQNFAKAWNKANERDPGLLTSLFTPEERQTINHFAAVSQRVTTPVTGGDNSSNTAVTQVAMQRLSQLPVLRNIPFMRDILGAIDQAAEVRNIRGATINAQPGRGGPRLPARYGPSRLTGPSSSTAAREYQTRQ